MADKAEERATVLLQPIATAPTDGRPVIVYVADREGLSAFKCVCAYHPEAGWCADEVRKVVAWLPGSDEVLAQYAATIRAECAEVARDWWLTEFDRREYSTAPLVMAEEVSAAIATAIESMGESKAMERDDG